MVEMHKVERRNLERFDLKIPARVQAMVLEQEHETQELLTTNVCSGGAFFQTPQPLPKGTEVKVDLTISLSKLKALKDEYQQVDIKIKGKVVRTDSQGMSISFDEDFHIVPLKKEKKSSMKISFKP